MLIQYFDLLKCLSFPPLYCMTSSPRNKRLSLAIAVGLLMFSNIPVWSQEVLYATTKYEPSQSIGREVLETLGKMKSMLFSYDESLKLETHIVIPKKNMPVKEILDIPAEQLDMEYELHGKQIVSMKKLNQKYTLSGYIRDAETGEELIGATISFKELPAAGAVTNAYGFYSITLPEGNYTALAQYIGYKVQRR
jgi:hypothetical protein